MENRYCVKFLQELSLQSLGWNLLALRHEIELQFDRQMFWGSYINDWYIKQDTLRIRESEKVWSVVRLAYNKSGIWRKLWLLFRHKYYCYLRSCGEIKMSLIPLFNVVDNSKYKETNDLSLKNIVALYTNGKESWFKRDHLGKL